MAIFDYRRQRVKHIVGRGEKSYEQSNASVRIEVSFNSLTNMLQPLLRKLIAIISHFF